MENRPAVSHGDDIGAARAPDGVQRVRHPARLCLPAYAVVMQDRSATTPHGEDVVAARAPNSVKRPRRPAYLRRPTRAVVMENRAGVAHGEDVGPTRTPDAEERGRGPARQIGRASCRERVERGAEDERE